MSPFDKFKTLEKMCAQEKLHLVIEDNHIGKAVYTCRVTVHYGRANHSERGTGDETISACGKAVDDMIKWIQRKE